MLGNSAYKAVAPLPNPRRDAEAIAEAFRKIGFQLVTLETDLPLPRATCEGAAAVCA